jgi:hypothetical protein
MRLPKTLSHSSVSLYHKDQEEFYLRYLCEHRPPRTPQQNFMAIGSAFDAYVKTELYRDLFGDDGKFEFDQVFNDQVEEHNREWARVEGAYVFKSYCYTGAYVELRRLLEQAKEPPRFEFTVTGQIGDAPFLGKPDCYFIHRSGFPVMLDWKVRGYCSKSPNSPTPGFQMCRDGWSPEYAKATRGANNPHKLYLKHDYHGMEINAGWLEHGSTDYADQLSAYTWLMGGEVGKEFLGCIDELVCKPGKERPLIRVAQHRSRVSALHQQGLFDRIQATWAACVTGHVFSDKTREESDERCLELDNISLGLQTDAEHGDYFNQIVRSGYR